MQGFHRIGSAVNFAVACTLFTNDRAGSQMRKLARPTLKDVAQLSGVSEISVSRVMRNTPNISATLRKKVEDATKALGYTPNRVAGALASNSTDLLAVIVPSISNSVFPEVLDGIDSVLSRTRYRTVLGISHYDEQREEEIVEDLLSWNPSGIILTGFEHSLRSSQLLSDFPNPVIEIMDADGSPIDISIGVSHQQAGSMMADHLVERGYHHIGYIGAGGERASRSVKRRESFTNRLQELGVPLTRMLIEAGDSSVVLGKESCSRMLQSQPETDAIFFDNDDLVVGAYLHCLQAGISIPENLALAGFNGLPFIDAMPMKITTIRTPRLNMGIAAAELFLQRMSAGKLEPVGSSRILMPLEFLAGETC